MPPTVFSDPPLRTRWRRWSFTTSVDPEHTLESIVGFVETAGGVPRIGCTDGMGARHHAGSPVQGCTRRRWRSPATTAWGSSRRSPYWRADIDKIISIIQNDGLPLVWVPRAQIVTEVLAASGPAARVRVLIDHANEVVEDCDIVLGAVTHSSLAGQVPLAKRAVDAFSSGHHEAAQALAVVVTETAVARAISDKYKKVKSQVLFDPNLVPYTELRLRAALAPIDPFYTAWYATSGAPAPQALSRHVTVHQADHNHFTHGNAAVAIMLATSVLRALQELQELAEASEAERHNA